MKTSKSISSNYKRNPNKNTSTDAKLLDPNPSHPTTEEQQLLLPLSTTVSNKLLKMKEIKISNGVD